MNKDFGKIDFKESLRFLFLVLLALNNMACIDFAKDSELASIEGSFSSMNMASKLYADPKDRINFSDYLVVCKSVDSEGKIGYGKIDQNGTFRLEVQFDQTIQCSVKEKEGLSLVAEMLVKDLFSGRELSSFSIRDSVSLGELNLDLDRREVVIPRDRVEGIERDFYPKAIFDQTVWIWNKPVRALNLEAHTINGNRI